MNILIIDDLESNIYILKRMIEIIRKDANVDIGKNGKEGLECCKLKKYDLIFTDIKMPLINGLEFIEKYRKIYGKGKIIITSAYQELDLDGTLYMRKPIDLKGLKTLFEII